MFASTALAGTFALVAVKMWDRGAQVGDKGPATAGITASSTWSPEALIAPIELWRLLYTSRVTPELFSREQPPERGGYRSRSRRVSRRPEIRRSKAARRATSAPAFVGAAAGFASAAFSAVSKTMDSNAVTSGARSASFFGRGDVSGGGAGGRGGGGGQGAKGGRGGGGGGGGEGGGGGGSGGGGGEERRPQTTWGPFH